MRKIAWGYVLWALLLVGALAVLWDSEALWEFFLNETLPRQNTSGQRLISILPWADPPPTPPPSPNGLIVTTKQKAP